MAAQMTYEQIIFCGKVYENDMGAMMVGDSHVAKEVDEWGVDGSVVYLRYFTSSKEIDLEQVSERLVKLITGMIDIEHDCIPYSEWTGFVSWDDTLSVDGHDLLDELSGQIGMFCYLELTRGEKGESD